MRTFMYETKTALLYLRKVIITDQHVILLPYSNFLKWSLKCPFQLVCPYQDLIWVNDIAIGGYVVQTILM